MFADDVVDGVGELQGLVGGGIEGPTSVAADGVAVKSGKANLGKSEIGWICDSRNDAEGRRIQVVVGNINLLPETVIADVELIGEPRTGRPHPRTTQHLGPCLRLREEQGI